MFPYRSSFSDFASKYGKDERFKSIEKMREREALFSDFVADVRRKEKEEKSQQKEKVCMRGTKRFVACWQCWKKSLPEFLDLKKPVAEILYS